jgi:hypothetical protein
MNRPRIHRTLAGIVAVVCVSLPTAAQACTVCMGDPNSKTAGAINAAIFLMIGFIGAMLASLGGFAFYLSRRAASPMPPHTELDQAINDPDDLS